MGVPYNIRGRFLDTSQVNTNSAALTCERAPTVNKTVCLDGMRSTSLLLRIYTSGENLINALICILTNSTNQIKFYNYIAYTLYNNNPGTCNIVRDLILHI